MQCASFEGFNLLPKIEKSSWAGQAKQMLVDLHAKVMIAKDAGATSLSKGQLQYWRKKYDELINEGLRIHPVPKKQKGIGLHKIDREE